MSQKAVNPALTMAREETGSGLQSSAARDLEYIAHTHARQVRFITNRCRISHDLARHIAELAFSSRRAA